MNQRLSPQLQKIQRQLDGISAAFRRAMSEGRYRQALNEALKAHRLIPRSVVPLSDAATAAVKGGFWQDGITYAAKALRIDPEHINSLDALAHAYGSLNDWENCRRYGAQALALRHRSITARPELPADLPPQNGKKIISFSLFGRSPEYLEPAVMNTELAGAIYPGWVCRFYTDGSVPESAVRRLQANGAEIVRVDEEAAQWPGTMWRFLALDDGEAARVIFRDADSVVSQREARAVAEWEAGGQRFHTLRDAGTHTELMMAGLWGAVAGSVPDIRAKIAAYLRRPQESRHFADQFFLREAVWPYACQSLCAHDRIFGFAGGVPFPDTEPFDYELFHVGSNEGNAYFEAVVGFSDGRRVCWRLSSRISPLLNPDYSHNLLPEERAVCAYEATVENGKISGMVPRRYAQGFSDGLSKITVTALG